MDHSTLDLESTIALAFITYIAYLNAYELHPGGETIFNNFIDECYKYI